jgi:tetratricopeptide (TPR) repeat protein
LKIDPDDPVAVTAQARLALEAKDLAKVIALYGKLLQFNPRDREAHLALAKMKAETGDGAGGAVELEAAMAISPDLETARLLATTYQGLKKSDEEAKALEKVAQLDAKAPAPWLRIAEIRKADGDSEGAEHALRQASERAPDDAAVQLSLARVIAERDELISSIEAYRAAKAKGAAEAAAELNALEVKAGLGKQIVGDPNRVYAEVFARLNRGFQELQKKNSELGGKMRARVNIAADGQATQVEMLEDTVHEPSLTALVYFSLKDARYPKKSTPTFEFVLTPAGKKK